jgi:hypothetical protein
MFDFVSSSRKVSEKECVEAATTAMDCARDAGSSAAKARLNEVPETARQCLAAAEKAVHAAFAANTELAFSYARMAIHAVGQIFPAYDLAAENILRNGFKQELHQANQEMRIWKDRALRAEENSKVGTNSVRGDDGSQDRYRRLKRMLAAEFHPDNCRVDGIEKIVRTELFKNIWPKVENIDRS